MPPRIPPRVLGSQETKADLVEHLVGLIDRTFAEDGHGKGMRAVRDVLMRLDRPALRALVGSMGLEGPEELSEAEREDRPDREE
ncbi:MAG TPA: hypothetical protein VLL51_04205 [Gemmatimonadales bacterium]|nr:hypothetical protein [Gemmatimonadales bacterium]